MSASGCGLEHAASSWRINYSRFAERKYTCQPFRDFSWPRWRYVYFSRWWINSRKLPRMNSAAAIVLFSYRHAMHIPYTAFYPSCSTMLQYEFSTLESNSLVPTSFHPAELYELRRFSTLQNSHSTRFGSLQRASNRKISRPRYVLQIDNLRGKKITLKIYTRDESYLIQGLLGFSKFWHFFAIKNDWINLLNNTSDFFKVVTKILLLTSDNSSYHDTKFDHCLFF